MTTHSNLGPVAQAASRVANAETALKNAQRAFFKKVGQELPERAEEYARERVKSQAEITNNLPAGAVRNLRTNLEQTANRIAQKLEQNGPAETRWGDVREAGESFSTKDLGHYAVEPYLATMTLEIEQVFVVAGYDSLRAWRGGFSGRGAYEDGWLEPVTAAMHELRSAKDMLEVTERRDATARAEQAWDDAR